MQGIYKITNIINKKVYIGSSYAIELRWKDHIKQLRANRHHSTHLQNSFNKYGESNFTFDVLEEVKEPRHDEVLFEREMFYMNEYKSFEKKYGYNMATTPRGGNSLNLIVAQYSNEGDLLNVFNSARQATIETGDNVLPNAYRNKERSVATLTNMSFAYIIYESIDSILDKIEVELNPALLHRESNIYLIIDFYTLEVIREFSGIDKIKLCEGVDEKFLKMIASTRQFFTRNNNIICCRKEEYDIMFECESNRNVLCAFDKDGNYLNCFYSKTDCGNFYGINPSGVNNCSKSNNIGEYTRHMRRYKGLIFKHYKRKDIPKLINVINGETLIIKA